MLPVMMKAVEMNERALIQLPSSSKPIFLMKMIYKTGGYE
jgi:hypothetical protein